MRRPWGGYSPPPYFLYLYTRASLHGSAILLPVNIGRGSVSCYNGRATTTETQRMPYTSPVVVTNLAPAAATLPRLMETLYTYFNGTSPGWQIKPGVANVTVPTGANPCGFVIQHKTRTEEIAFTNNTAGAYTSDYRYISASRAALEKHADRIHAAFCVPGGIVDIMNMAAVPRYSGYAVDLLTGAPAGSSNAPSSLRIIESTPASGPPWMIWVMHTGGTPGFIAVYLGYIEAFSSDIVGFAIHGGQLQSSDYFSSEATTLFTGVCELAPGGFVAVRSSSLSIDASGGFAADYGSVLGRICMCALQADAGADQWLPVGMYQGMYLGPRPGAAGELWREPGGTNVAERLGASPYVYLL